MKKILIVFFLTMIVPIYCFSQTTLKETNPDSILISSEQLRYTNLIFVEHNRLLVENKLLSQENINLNLMCKSLERIDSIRLQDNMHNQLIINQQNNELSKIKLDLKHQKNNIIKIGCVSITVGILIGWLINL